MALQLQDMYLWLEHNPKAARLLIKRKALDSPDMTSFHRQNVDDICNVARKPSGKNTNGVPDKVATGFSHSPKEPKASCLIIPFILMFTP